MATRSETNTLSGTTADTVTLSQNWDAVSITNHDATNTLYARVDGQTAVAQADENIVILPGQSVVVAVPPRLEKQTVVSVVGNGNIYTVEGVN